MSDIQMEIIARSFIIEKERVLLCKANGKGHYFFPGGHVEIGETSEEALKREFMEELGVEVFDIKFAGVSENAFDDSESSHQEINIVFEAKIKNNEVVSLENHLDFDWIEIEKIDEVKVLPENLKESFLKWFDDKKCFYIS